MRKIFWVKIYALGVGVLASCATSEAQPRGARRAPPPEAALDACSGMSTDDQCSFEGRGATVSGACFAPPGRPLACRPLEGRQASAERITGKTQVNTDAHYSTDGVLCNLRYSDTNISVGLQSKSAWRCLKGERQIIGNGVPDHIVGKFPNRGNPNTISAQSISTSMPLTPIKSHSSTFIGGPGGVGVYALNSVKFDPGTAGTCSDGAQDKSECDLGRGRGPWRIEALGQDVFDFGEDMNNAHVQPSGEYHYHGIPEGILTKAGVTEANKKMLLVGWAADGFPVYARYCYADPMDSSSAIKSCEGSFVRDMTPDAGRPSSSWVPLGAFSADWSYQEGSGDLDECNGRVGVTPEFPDSIYYYMATDSYPYFSRCLKGQVTMKNNTPKDRGEPSRGRN